MLNLLSFTTHTCDMGIRPLLVKSASPVHIKTTLPLTQALQIIPMTCFRILAFSILFFDSLNNFVRFYMTNLIFVRLHQVGILSHNQQRWLRYFVLSSMPQKVKRKRLKNKIIITIAMIALTAAKGSMSIGSMNNNAYASGILVQT